MKTLFRLFFLMFFSAILLSSCGVHRQVAKSHKASPGHVKKITGSKSAKPYAPGHNKKKKKHKDLP